MITIKNSYQGQLNYRAGDLPETTKSGKDHGSLDLTGGKPILEALCDFRRKAFCGIKFTGIYKTIV